jgi:FkbM family methyltransferase
MPMISYAQNHEDVLLARLFPPGLRGFYVDVGANDPLKNSITKHFYDLGWRGVNVEPASDPFKRLAEARPRDVNLNVGLSDHEGTLTLYEFPPDISAVSTFSEEQAEWHREAGLASIGQPVTVTTLAKVLEEHVADVTVDFLSIDVEGHERQVLVGGDWDRFRPRVVIVESTQPATTIPTHEQWEDVLLGAGYLFAAFDGLNRYYLREEDAGLAPALATPVNVTDDYVPYEYIKSIQDLNWALDATSRSLAAARAVNNTLRAELGALPAEMAGLRAEYERLDRALANIRLGYDDMLARQADERAPYEELLRDVGPVGLGVARRLARISKQHPGPATLAHKTVRVALNLKRRAGG